MPKPLPYNLAHFQQCQDCKEYIAYLGRSDNIQIYHMTCPKCGSKNIKHVVASKLKVKVHNSISQIKDLLK